MLVPQSTGVMKQLLKEFKPVFNKPQHRHFSTYITGLIAIEGKKNIKNINNAFTEHRDQSTLNRFITEPSWSLQRLEEKRLELAMKGLPVKPGSTGTLIIDDTITKKTGKKMEYIGYHYDHTEGKTVMGHNLVTCHYVNGDSEYPVGLRLYVKKGTCDEEVLPFRTKIELAVDQIKEFRAPPGTDTVVAYDSWYFCRKVVEACRCKGFDWVTQAKSNRVIKRRGVRMSVTELAESTPSASFRCLMIGKDEYSVCGFRVWMNGVGKVRLVVSREEDGFHFYVSNRVDWSVGRVVAAYRRRQSVEVYIRDVKQNLGLGECQARRGRGAIIHWHLVYVAYTLLALLRRSLLSVNRRLCRFLRTVGDVCRWVRKQCLRRLVDLVMAMTRRHARPETVYRVLQI
jgi:hypothetical protein